MNRENMKRTVFIMLLVATAILLAAGCRRMDPVYETGELELMFSIEELATKATETATLQNGGLFNNLLVVLVKDNGEDTKALYWDQRDFTSGVSTGSVRFRNVKNGAYQVYAFANLRIDFNTDGSHWKDKSWEDVAKDLAKDDNVLSTNDDGELVVNINSFQAVIASGVESLLNAEGAMLLTGKAEVDIDGATVKVNGSTTGKITLQRPFVRLTVEIHNPTGRDVKFDKLSFSAFKPDKTFLFGRQTGSTPSIPDDSGYTEFAAGADRLPSAAWKTEVVKLYETYIFENDAAEEYKIYGHVIMDPGEENQQDLYLGLGDAPEEPDPDFKGNGSVLQKMDPYYHTAAPIESMLRNQAFLIIVNIYYGSSEGDIDFSVEAWTEGKGGSHVFK